MHSIDPEDSGGSTALHWSCLLGAGPSSLLLVGFRVWGLGFRVQGLGFRVEVPATPLSCEAHRIMLYYMEVPG